MIRSCPSLSILLLALFSALLATGGCSDSTSPTGSNNNNNTTQITGDFYIQANVNGKIETQQEGASGTTGVGQNTHGSMGGGSRPGYQVVQRYRFVRILSIFPPTPDTTFRSMEIAIIRNFNDQPYSSSDYKFFLIQGELMNYGSEDKEVDGVEITWKDAAGTVWGSSLGSGDQTGSRFVVTEHTKVNYLPGQTTEGLYRSKGTFNCKLYDGKGNSITVTDGKFSLRTVYV